MTRIGASPPQGKRPSFGDLNAGRSRGPATRYSPSTSSPTFTAPPTESVSTSSGTSSIATTSPNPLDEVFFRIVLFKLFNKIETWTALEAALGPITFKDYSFQHYDRVLTLAMARGRTIYSAAYIMPCGRPQPRPSTESTRTTSCCSNACSRTLSPSGSRSVEACSRRSCC